MLDNQGEWKAISEQCKTCVYLQVRSVFMSGERTYYCARYPKQKGEKCPAYEKITTSEIPDEIVTWKTSEAL